MRRSEGEESDWRKGENDYRRSIMRMKKRGKEKRKEERKKEEEREEERMS